MSNPNCTHCGWPVTSYWQWRKEPCFLAKSVQHEFGFMMWGNHDVSQEHMRAVIYPDGAKTA